jgi:putative toxin-antitoxin system antitoxin component (TIGR02293 family)
MQVHSLKLKAQTTDQMISQLKQGLPADAFDRLREQLNVSDNTLANIVQIPKRTLDRRRATGRLKTDESERVLRLARVFDMAVDVLGNPKKAESWLKKPARGLGGKIPLEYADTELGAHEVIALLGRIDHGVFPG